MGTNKTNKNEISWKSCSSLSYLSKRETVHVKLPLIEELLFSSQIQRKVRGWIRRGSGWKRSGMMLHFGKNPEMHLQIITEIEVITQQPGL